MEPILAYNDFSLVHAPRILGSSSKEKLMQTIENLLISRGELDRIYIGNLNLYLWRALHTSSDASNPLYPDFQPRQIRTGHVRAPDVEIKLINGVEYVVARLGDGTSLFDAHGVFGPNNWTYFEIPAGTEIPRGLIITKDAYNKKYRATHYSISPNYMMPKRTFIQLLDHLAQNAKLRKARMANGGT